MAEMRVLSTAGPWDGKTAAKTVVPRAAAWAASKACSRADQKVGPWDWLGYSWAGVTGAPWADRWAAAWAALSVGEWAAVWAASSVGAWAAVWAAP